MNQTASREPSHAMLTIEEALVAVLQHARPVPATQELAVRALHCVLAEDVAALAVLPRISLLTGGPRSNARRISRSAMRSG